ncbi:MAG: hypothetical protein COW67_07945 [Flavobacteriales bacterium CG18_big_fil_WC_8_21_14_2_50_32_9]|nr:MAG: hypothetical protein COW67_07945 [Flavobacteriales bacterium CG18_big_fil_WC_8_21_14_2_50_32_9]PJC62673.1 MAG: hypothetical protein CO022_03295 [Flavobacteriales bacterium CG_4_9_14_0_2_um_filter_32_27]
MQKIVFSFTLIFLSLIGISQDTTGVITYEEVINTAVDMAKAEEQGWSQWAELVPKSMTFKKKLIFTPSFSMYSNIPEEEDPNESNMVKRMARRYANANNQTYINSETNDFVEQQDFMGKTFLIKGKPEEIKWKMTAEMKEIMGYVCLKAIYTDTANVIEAWFTADIAVPVGPEKYGGLPGVILELSNKKDKKVLTAIKIEFRTIDPSEVQEPSKGKEVTREEYNKIVQDKIKEMRENGGGWGH